MESSTFAAIAKDKFESKEAVCLPKIQILVATKSAEAGINGKYLEFGKCNGIPASLYELVQQLGRLDREGSFTPGSNTYEIHADFYSYVSLVVRIMKCPC